MRVRSKLGQLRVGLLNVRLVTNVNLMPYGRRLTSCLDSCLRESRLAGANIVLPLSWQTECITSLDVCVVDAWRFHTAEALGCTGKPGRPASPETLCAED